MIRQGKEVRAFANVYRGGVGIWLLDYDEQGSRLIAKPIVYEHDDFREERPASIKLLDERAQQLIDDLWSAGLRPTQGRQSEGVTAAQARHLDDMRAIVADKLKVTLP